MHKNKTKGFTLAEILITISIIGVVAAMTIPSLINKIEMKQYQSSLKKNYSNFSQAIYTLASQNNLDLSSETNFINSLESQMSMGKKGTFASTTNLPANFNYKCYKSSSGMCGNLLKRPNIDASSSFITNDGTRYLLYSFSSECNSSNYHVKINPTEITPQNNACAVIYLDTNGDKNPNQIGVDLHMFFLVKKDNEYYLRPSGANVDTNCQLDYPEDYNKSLHCTNRMLLDQTMP